MKRLLIAAVVLLVCALGVAQEAPRAELFAGYSYLRDNPTGLEGVNLHGWETSLTFNFNKHWGLTGDFSGHYCCSGEHLHTFLGGPQFAWRQKESTVFIHGLVGGAHAQGSGIADTSIAWAAGGGLDWDFHPKVGWRVFQADYLGTHFLSNTQNNFRLSTGILFRFGSR